MDEGVRHPRSRAVAERSAGRSGIVRLLLECGHVTRRRVSICEPRRVLCAECRD
ncbi:MAG: hypothetical protein ACJ8ER_17455 [Allosphingosinicella sp.]